MNQEPLSEGSRSISMSFLGRLQRREADAWTRFAEIYQPVVYKWAQKWGLQTADAEEMNQEIFIVVDKKIASFHNDQPGDSFKSWFNTIVRNKILEFYRRRPTRLEAEGGSDAQNRLAQVPEEDWESVSREVDADIKTRLVRQAVEMIRAEFEERTWQAFCSRTFDDLPAAEVAKKLGMTEAAVHKARSRVLKRLREALEGLLD
jgi:RNA polymerase sigma-70 factor, ECF subfamily